MGEREAKTKQFLNYDFQKDNVALVKSNTVTSCFKTSSSVRPDWGQYLLPLEEPFWPISARIKHTGSHKTLYGIKNEITLQLKLHNQGVIKPSLPEKPKKVGLVPRLDLIFRGWTAESSQQLCRLILNCQSTLGVSLAQTQLSSFTNIATTLGIYNSTAVRWAKWVAEWLRFAMLDATFSVWTLTIKHPLDWNTNYHCGV